MRFVIYTPPYSERVGGRVVLHYLCHLLNEIGEQAMVYPRDGAFSGFNTCPRYRTPVCTTPRPDAVVVYPDIVRGNPLNTKNVVRWQLYHPRHPVDAGDLVFYYSSQFGEGPYLTVLDPRLDLFKHLGMHRPRKQCYIFHKAFKQGWTKEEVESEMGDTLCVDGKPLNVLAEIFNTTQDVICYDNATFTALQARLCGAAVTVRSKDGTSNMSKYAGLSRGKLRARLKREQEASKDDAAYFAKVCKEKFGE